MGLKTWIRMEEIHAKDWEKPALQIALAAAQLIPESKPTNRKKQTWNLISSPPKNFPSA